MLASGVGFWENQSDKGKCVGRKTKWQPSKHEKRKGKVRSRFVQGEVANAKKRGGGVKKK